MADLHGNGGRAAVGVADAPAEGQGVTSCLLHGERPAAGVARHVRTRLPVALVSWVHVRIAGILRCYPVAPNSLHDFIRITTVCMHALTGLPMRLLGSVCYMTRRSATKKTVALVAAGTDGCTSGCRDTAMSTR